MDILITNEIAKEISVASVPNLRYNHKDSWEYSLAYNKEFADIVVPLLSSKTLMKKAISVYRYAYGKSVFFGFTVTPHVSTAKIFDLFKRCGVFCSNMSWEYDPTDHKLRVPAKIFKILKMYDTVRAANIVMMFVQLSQFIVMLNCKKFEIEVDPSYVDIVPEDASEMLLPDVSKYIGITFSVGVTTSSEVSAIVYKSTKYSDVMSSKVFDSNTVIVPIMYKDGNSSVLLTQAYSKTACVVFRYAEPAGIVTNIPMTSYDTAGDTVLSNFASVLANLAKSDVTVFTDACNLEDWRIVSKEDLSAPVEALYNALVELGVSDTVTLENISALTNVTKIVKSTSCGYVAADDMREMYKDDEYAQRLYKQTLPYFDEFPLGTLEANLAGFAKGSIYSMMFIGESGTGKSTSARVLPYRCGMPYVSINFSVNIEESDIIGTYMPNMERKDTTEPEFIWKDGVLTKAIRNGYCVILEEINFARPGVLGKLNSLLDETRQIDLPTGEVVKAHPNFRIIATCNIAYEGTNRFNKALINRFEDVTIFNDLDRAEAVDTIIKRTGYTNHTNINTIYSVYESIKKYSKEQNLNLTVSMRQLLTLFTNGKFYKNAYDAVLRIMVNGAFIEYPEYLEEYVKTVLGAFDLKFKI